jgi:hypothetical protein
MKRREFITLFGGAAAWPLAARGYSKSSDHAAVIALRFWLGGFDAGWGSCSCHAARTFSARRGEAKGEVHA